MYVKWWKWKSLSHVQQFVTPNSPGQNTGVGSLFLLQGIFPIQGSNSGLLHCRQILYQLSHKESPRTLEWIAFPFSRGFLTQESNRGSPALQADSPALQVDCYVWEPHKNLRLKSVKQWRLIRYHEFNITREESGASKGRKTAQRKMGRANARWTNVCHSKQGRLSEFKKLYIIKCEIDHQSRLDARDKCSGLVHWNDSEGWDWEGGGRRVQDGEHM